MVFQTARPAHNMDNNQMKIGTYYEVAEVIVVISARR